ncbi:MAG: putative nucleotidyltransferase substrate binding domain-containing protein [Bacillota bacterium]|nr:putative nucleotidyltransferase substrate binding domain-containing protein [Bacillota bacterium]
MEILSFLQQTAPFDQLPKAVLMQTCSRLKLKKFDRGSHVFIKGEKSHQVLYLVYQGLAEIIVASDNKNIGYTLRKPHDFFGETVFLTGNTYPASVRAVKELSCLILDLETFENLCVKYPAFAKFFNQILSERMRTLYNDLVLNQISGIEERRSTVFRNRFGEIMVSPVITCSTTDSVFRAAELMRKHSISSVAVLNNQGELAGLITEKELVAGCINNNKPPTAWPLAKEVMNGKPVIMSPDTLYYQGLLSMIRNKCKHVLVAEDKKLLGIITTGDLVKFKNLSAFNIIEEIERQVDLQNLTKIRGEVISLLKALVADKANPVEICEIITEFNDRIIGKAIKLCEQELEKGGFGLPPVPYAWFAMGSSGRKEQLVKAELRNGIVYEDSDKEEASEVFDYFKRLTVKINNSLIEIGYEGKQDQEKKGSSYWCKSVSQWYQTIKEWANSYHSVEVEATAIKDFFDLRPIYGRVSLASNIKQFGINAFQQPGSFLQHVITADLSKEVPVDIFKMTITEKKKVHKASINIKEDACNHVINCIRALALKEGIEDASTLQRINELTKQVVFSEEDGDYIDAAYKSLIMFRLKNKLEMAELGKEAENYIDPNRLSSNQYCALREAFIAANQLQNFTRNIFELKYNVSSV